VWAAGQWDWRGGKYEWTPGHWERERAGKQWRPGRWEQKDGHWQLVPGDWVEVGGKPVEMPPPPVGDVPTMPPPPPKEERNEPRAGFVWVAGQWDWRGGKYDWTPGHWERERAGKHWRPTRWEQHEGKWTQVVGDWEDEGAAVPPPPPPGEPPAQHHRSDWKLERPTVSSYWPTRGKPGTRITIHGVNFPADAKVVFAGAPVLGAKVEPDKIVFEVPKDAASGDIALDRGHGRPLPVGSFEVKAGFDPAAEQKRIDDDRRKQAEAQWAGRQKDLAKDRAAREAAVRKQEDELEGSRDHRREQRAAEIRAKWDAAFLADPDTQDELTLHAQRVAELTRMKEMADLSADAKLGVRIDLATQKENDRHDQRMTALHTSFGGAK
jgi:hypothetical protein